MSTSATIVAALLAKRENTRLALATALVAANAELAELRLAKSQATAAPAPVATETEVAQIEVSWPEAPAPVAKPVANKWIGRPVQVVKRELPAHMAAARDLAMRLGRVVRVGA
jgi:hypothetical protein